MTQTEARAAIAKATAEAILALPDDVRDAAVEGGEYRLELRLGNAVTVDAVERPAKRRRTPRRR